MTKPTKEEVETAIRHLRIRMSALDFGLTISGRFQSPPRTQGSGWCDDCKRPDSACICTHALVDHSAAIIAADEKLNGAPSRSKNVSNSYKQELTFTEIGTRGVYVGQCRNLFNILEQWDGKRWRRVPDVVDGRPKPRGFIHFDVDDFGREP